MKKRKEFQVIVEFDTEPMPQAFLADIVEEEKRQEALRRLIAAVRGQ